MTEQILNTVERETGAKPTHAVIWMHGLGDNGHSFVPYVQLLRINGGPDIRFVFPHAPSMPVTLNSGYVMPAWYDVYGMDIVTRQDETGFRRSQAAIEQLIARENARGIATENILLAGFSQGGAMTLQVGLRHPEKLAGMICLSSYLPLGHTVMAEKHAANAKTPILMAHGRYDPVIRIEHAEKSRDYLAALGYHVDWREYPLEHSISDVELRDIAVWLRQIFIREGKTS